MIVALQTMKGGGDWRYAAWLALLVAASVAFTLGFACAVPLAAFGAATALTLPRRGALLVVWRSGWRTRRSGLAFSAIPGTANA